MILIFWVESKAGFFGLRKNQRGRNPIANHIHRGGGHSTRCKRGRNEGATRGRATHATPQNRPRIAQNGGFLAESGILSGT